MATPRKRFVPRPDQVKVGPMVFSIEWVGEQEWGEHWSGYEDDGGLTFHASAKILMRLVPMVSEQQLREVLLHEVLHAIWSTSMLSHIAGDFTHDKLEEGVVMAMSPYLLGVLKENPDVLAYLLDDQEH